MIEKIDNRENRKRSVMKNIVTSRLFSLGSSMINSLMITSLIIAFPIFIHCDVTNAYSPSIPGQPLIFHTTTPSISSADQKIIKELSSKEIENLFKLSTTSIQFSEGLLGLIGTAYLPITQDQQGSLSSLYNQDINVAIGIIYQEFLSFRGGSSKRFADLINQTLISFVEIANQMIGDTVGSSSNALFQQDYQEMQDHVINYFKAGVANIYNNNGTNRSLKAEAESALEGLVSCLTLYISSLQSLVNDGNAGQRNMVFARQKLFKNLAAFVEDTFILQSLTHTNHG